MCRIDFTINSSLQYFWRDRGPIANLSWGAVSATSLPEKALWSFLWLRLFFPLQISVWIKPKLKRVSRRLQSSPKRWGINHSGSPPTPSPVAQLPSGKFFFPSSELPDKLSILHALINTWLWRYMIRISITRIVGNVLMYIYLCRVRWQS